MLVFVPGETSYHIISKAMIKSDILEAAGNLQGQEAGCEPVVHAMHSLFNSSTTQDVLLADASNAFNSLNRRVSLHNLHYICPLSLPMSTGKAASLFIDSEFFFFYPKRELQGDPFAKLFLLLLLLKG